METEERQDSLVQLNIRVPLALKTDLKIIATLEGVSLEKFVTRELQVVAVSLLNGATSKTFLRGK